MKAKPQLFLTLLVIPMLCVALHASATPMTPITNIVNNGGFESGAFAPGWTQSGNTANTGVDGDSPHSGTSAAGFGNVGSVSFLDQTLTTIVGATYDLSFFLASEGSKDAFTSGGSGTQIFQVFWNGVMVFNLGPSGPFGYTQYGASGLTVTGTSTVLEFRIQNDPAFFDLDDITVTGNTASTVPETLPTMWLGLTFVGMVGLFQLRRKRA
jgi:hypothetical protein